MADQSYTPTTYSGKNLFHVSSAFQKEIRRGNEEDAVHWGLELYNSGYANYAWKRMTYIVSEDIGIANESLPSQFMALRAMYDWHKKEFVDKGKDDDGGKLFFIHALMLLVRSPKSRICEDVLWNGEEDWRTTRHSKEIPDYALGFHTQEGKAMGRGLTFFHEVEAQIYPVADVPGAEYWANRSVEMSKVIDATGKYPCGMSIYAKPRKRTVKPVDGKAPALKRAKKKPMKGQMELL